MIICYLAIKRKKTNTSTNGDESQNHYGRAGE
jgi:hypothetical protein